MSEPVARGRGRVTSRTVGWLEGGGMGDQPNPFLHAPVMRSEITELFAEVPPGVLIDATVGGGGHAAALLEARPELTLLGLDQDGDALDAARERLAPFRSRVTLHRARFDQLALVVGQLGYETVAGVLFDLGVSSPQLDRPERGFSYRAAGPLDMRMDQRSGITAADVVNGYDERALARVLREHGDERYAGRIAKAIVAARPLTTTADLADVVRAAIPAPARRTGGHPAKRTFQAIRIEVNAEMDVLADALDQAVDVLSPGGRIAVLAYHSGEDRIVKERLRAAASTGVTPPPGLPVEPESLGVAPRVRLLKQGAWKPTAEEIAANPRSESARLRAAEKLAPESGS
jgi:16S rRNA (cytosine1402-N4)-methyltransferase